MHSLRTRITLLTVCMIIIAVTSVTVLSVLFIQRNEHRQSDQLLLMLCDTGERNLDYYFNSVEIFIENFASGYILFFGCVFPIATAAAIKLRKKENNV